MSEVQFNPTCKEYEASKPKTLVETEQKEIIILSDLAKVLKMYGIMKEAAAQTTDIAKTLSQTALGLFQEAKDMVKNEPSATIRIIKSLEEVIKIIDELPQEQRTRFVEDRAKFVKMLDIMRRAAESAGNIAKTLSQDGLALYRQTIKEDRTENATLKILSSMENTAKKLAGKLSAPTRTKLGLSESVPLPTYEKVVDEIKFVCTPVEVDQVLPEQIVEQQQTKGKTVREDKADTQIVAEPSFWSALDFYAYLGGGFSYRAVGKDSPDIMAENPKGVAFTFGAGGAYKVNDGLAIQLDYKLAGSYDVIGDDNLANDSENADLAFNYKSETVGMVFKAGYQKSRNDYPSEVYPSTIGGTQSLNLYWNFDPSWSLNINESLHLGLGQKEYRVKSSFYGRASFDPTVTLKFGSNKSVGLTFGLASNYENLSFGFLGGAAVGISYTEGKNTFAVLARYGTNGSSHLISAGIKYSYNDFNIGAYYDFLKTNYSTYLNTNIMAGYVWKLPWDLFIEFYGGGQYGRAQGDNALNVMGGINFGYGATYSQNPDPLLPYSTDPMRQYR